MIQTTLVSPSQELLQCNPLRKFSLSFWLWGWKVAAAHSYPFCPIERKKELEQHKDRSRETWRDNPGSLSPKSQLSLQPDLPWPLYNYCLVSIKLLWKLSFCFAQAGLSGVSIICNKNNKNKIIRECVSCLAGQEVLTQGSYMEIFQKGPREEEVWWDLKDIWLRFAPGFVWTLSFASWASNMPWGFTGRLSKNQSC